MWGDAACGDSLSIRFGSHIFDSVVSNMDLSDRNHSVRLRDISTAVECSKLF